MDTSIFTESTTTTLTAAPMPDHMTGEVERRDFIGAIVGYIHPEEDWEKRCGYYPGPNGEPRLMSWGVPFEVPGIGTVWFSWSTYVKDNVVHGWARADKRISVRECAANKTIVKVWRTDDNRMHFELSNEAELKKALPGMKKAVAAARKKREERAQTQQQTQQLQAQDEMPW